MAETPTTRSPSAFKTEQEKERQAIGLQNWKNMSGIDLDAWGRLAGRGPVKDSANGPAKPHLPDDEILTTLDALKPKMTA